MADPLSVAAGVVGLITAGAQMITVLYNIGSSIKDAPQLTQAAAGELADITVVLQQLQVYVLGKARASAQRLNLITVEHITATLTGCVVTYSELDTVLKSLHIDADTGLRAWDRGLWFLKKDKVASIIQRLQNHKSTLALMLNILQCASLSEAETSMDKLCDAVNEVLRSNQELSLRLRNMEQLHTTQQAIPSFYASQDADVQAATEASRRRSDESVVLPIRSSAVDEMPSDNPRTSQEHAHVSNFEELLHRSRVYRHVERDDYTPSLISDARSTLAISICSSLTLGEVSNISVYAIPVYAHEISNAECYHFMALQNQTTVMQQPTTESVISKATQTPKKRRWRTMFRRSARPPAPDVVLAAEDAVFGVPLQVSLRYANVALSLLNDEGDSYIYGYVPIIVAKCGAFLKEKGLDVENLFEVSSHPKRLVSLQTAFNSPPRYGKGLDWAAYSVHDVAAIFLRYLLQLPEPLIPLEYYERFRDPFRSLDGLAGPPTGALAVATSRTYGRLVHELPARNRECLLYVIDFMTVILARSEFNKSTVSRLAAAFQPGILAHPNHRLVAEELRLSQSVVAYFLQQIDGFIAFTDDNESPTEAEKGEDRPLQVSLLHRSASFPSLPVNLDVPDGRDGSRTPDIHIERSRMVMRSNTVPTRKTARPESRY